MEAKELVFEVVNNLSYALVLFEKSEKSWSQSYQNEAMKKLIGTSKEGEKKTASNIENENSLNELIDNYDKQGQSDSVTLHNVEIFNAVYNVHINKNGNNLLLFFIEIPAKELFNNFTFHDLSQACSSMIVILDNRGDIIDINECFLNLVGMQKEAVVKKSFFDTFMPAYKEKLAPYLQEILSKDVYNQHFVTPLKGENEKKYQINWHVSKIVKGEQTYVIAVGSDITKFIEQNGDLKRQLISIKVGFDYFPLAIGYMNASGKFITMNPRFKKMFEIEKESENVIFDDIAISQSNNTSFEKIKEYTQLIKEMSYKTSYNFKGEIIKLKVDIRLIESKKESSKLYIVVVQKIK